ncbi:MAG: hypothetical protein ACP5N7_01180 [Candidatus Pacearchaeota archaeon]
MKKHVFNHDYLIEELRIMNNCYDKLIKGTDYDKEMALKIKEEIIYLEKQLNPFTANVNNKE